MKTLLLIALRLKIAILRWWYIRRASAMLHARVRWELRAERDLSRSDSESANMAYQIAEKYRIRDFAYQLRLKQICPEVQIGVPPWWSAHEDAWKSGALPLLIALCLSLCSCAGTRVYVNGKPALATYADIERIKFKTTPAATELEMEGVNHSGPTREMWNGIDRTASKLLTPAAVVPFIP